MKAKDNNDKHLESSKIIDDCITKQFVQSFFNYGNTKMSTFATDYNIRMAKVGKRIFYKYSDIVRLINDSQTKR